MTKELNGDENDVDREHGNEEEMECGIVFGVVGEILGLVHGLLRRWNYGK
jgi:hypothetical protein